MSIVKKFLHKFRQILLILKEDDMGCLLELSRDRKIKEREKARIRKQMKILGFTGEDMWAITGPFVPVHNVSAVKLAEHYGIEFSQGLGMYQCKAVLPRAKWKNPINENVPLELLTRYDFIRTYDEVGEFEGSSEIVEIAICKCLIRARTAGVI